MGGRLARAWAEWWATELAAPTVQLLEVLTGSERVRASEEVLGAWWVLR